MNDNLVRPISAAFLQNIVTNAALVDVLQAESHLHLQQRLHSQGYKRTTKSVGRDFCQDQGLVLIRVPKPGRVRAKDVWNGIRRYVHNLFYFIVNGLLNAVRRTRQAESEYIKVWELYIGSHGRYWRIRQENTRCITQSTYAYH